MQYCGPLKRKEVCNVGVGAAFASESKHFPIDIIPYLPASEFPRGKNNPHAYLTKILETKPTTFNEIKQAINAMLEFASTNALSKNEKLANAYFKIKSKRLKKKCAA